MEDKNLRFQLEQRMLSDKPKKNINKKRQKEFNLNKKNFFIQASRIFKVIHDKKQ